MIPYPTMLSLTAPTGENATDGEATWNDAIQATTAWTTGGAQSDDNDRDADRDTLIRIDKDGQNDNSDHTIYVNKASVDSMRTAAGNMGWVFEKAPESVGSISGYYYCGDDFGDADSIPILTVWYTIPGAAEFTARRKNVITGNRDR
ncbi:MAG: hypothetical protein ACYS21_07100 [Planctomycetota bacterium]